MKGIFQRSPIRFYFLLFLIAIPAFMCAGAEDIPLSPTGATVGMERSSWALEPWGNSGTADKTASVNGQKLLKLIFTSGDNDKTAYKHLTYLSLPKTGKIRVYIYSSESKPPQIGLALSSTLAYRWHESPPKDLKQGWNTLEFSPNATAWKSQASDWKFTVPVEPIDDIRAIELVVYNGKRNGVLYAQGLQYDLDERGEKIAAAIKRLQSEDIEERAKAEKELVAMGKPAMEALYQIAEDDRPEVLLRAASALRQIDEAQEELPADPKVREELLKQKEEQHFDESRRRAEYTLHGLENERLKLIEILKESQAEVGVGSTELEQLKYVDVEKRKVYEEILKKLSAALKEMQPLALPKKSEK